MRSHDLLLGGASTGRGPDVPDRPFLSWTYDGIFGSEPTERRERPPYFMIRSGDVIVVAEFFYYPT